MSQNIMTKELKKGEIIPLSFDYMFTEIFNDEENIGVLESFLALYLDLSLEDVRGKIKILSRDIKREYKGEAKAQVDLLFDFYQDKYNIELNNYDSKGKINRNLTYISKVYGKQFKRSMTDYTNIHRAIQINFNNYRCNFDDVIDTYYLRNEKGEVLSENLKIEQIDMVLGSDKCYTDEKKDKIARWCKLLRATKLKELERIIGDDLMGNEDKEKLLDRVEELSSDEDMYTLYSDLSKEELERNTFIAEAREEALKQGIEKGIEQGIEKGIEQSKYEVVKNLLHMGMSKEDISRATGLSIEEIKNFNGDIL